MIGDGSTFIDDATIANTSGTWDTAYGDRINNISVSTTVTDQSGTYALVDGSRNLQTQTISDTYTGTIGDTSIGYGIETTGNLTNKGGNYILFSATTGYQFRSPTVTFTDTDFPTTLGRIPSFKHSGVTIVNTGTDNINSTGALVPLDTSVGFPAYGEYGTDYTYTTGQSYVTINTAGTYEVTFNAGYRIVTGKQGTCAVDVI